ncbi:MAG: glycosyl transferase [Candidatus Endolissoclinum sp. TMED37]|nr:MAG: glycosyl transferase [Candidatus Endolissoclinum sp. TMED37]|tara:strand:+ start:61 stop:768 length:708 start_codon:yes stop_codon:yes gene_type:complete
MKLSIIIPCFNEDKTIEKVINNILEQEYKDIEIIVVDDFSDDKTRHKLKNSLSSKIDKLIFHSTNQGKGAAIRTGIKETTGEIILIQDADLEYDPSEYTKLINPILSGRADIVYGSRFIGSNPHRAVYFWHKIANNFLTLLSNIFSGLNLTDIETCYKVFKSNIIKKIKIEENGFGIEAEITAKISRKKYKIYEVGISYYGRTYQEGKKITWRDGFKAIFCILKYNIKNILDIKN